jgi:hypothetical protein
MAVMEALFLLSVVAATEHYYNTPLYQWYVTLCNNRQSAHCCCPIITMVHVAHARLLIASIAATGRMISADCYYYGAHGTRAGATSAHNSDGLSDISLLLPQTMRQTV